MSAAGSHLGSGEIAEELLAAILAEHATVVVADGADAATRVLQQTHDAHLLNATYAEGAATEVKLLGDLQVFTTPVATMKDVVHDEASAPYQGIKLPTSLVAGDLLYIGPEVTSEVVVLQYQHGRRKWGSVGSTTWRLGRLAHE